MQDTSEESQRARDSEKPKISIFTKMDLGPFRIGGDLDLGPFKNKVAIYLITMNYLLKFDK